MLVLIAIAALFGTIWFSDDFPVQHRWKACLTVGLVFAAVDLVAGIALAPAVVTGALRGAVAAATIWLVFRLEDGNRGLAGSALAMGIGVGGAALALWLVPFAVHAAFP